MLYRGGMEMYFIQMSGFPGSGKSTLAREIANRMGFIIIDHDIVKSALLNSIEADSSFDGKLAGKISYTIDFSLADFHLSQGHSVILDSPCLYEEMIEKGIKLAQKYDAEYKYIECYLDDFEEINHRLKSREKMPSQISEIRSKEGFYATLNSAKKPTDFKCLVVDTSQPIERYIENVIRYIKFRMPRGN